MASFTGVNGTQLPAAMLTDPKALKKHLTNGTLISSHLQPSLLPARRSSTPSYSQLALELPSTPDIALQSSKDDAYLILENKGRKLVNSQKMTNTGQAALTTFNPRHLLDPKGFNTDERQRDHKSDPIDSKPLPVSSNRQLDSGTSSDNKDALEINVNSLHKRDREDYKGQGMGSLIERVYNVSQREERPQKKPKVENDEFNVEEAKNVISIGGGKGGEFGDYLKDKKKQGIAESGPINAVVDLTGGTYHFCKHNSLDR